MNENPEQIEQDILEQVKTKINTDPNLNIKETINNEIQRKNYLKEDWQMEYAYERIYQKLKPDLVLNKLVNNRNGLISDEKAAAQLMAIKCNNCGHVGEPTKWTMRTGLGIFYFFTLFNVIGILIYFVSTNPYICEKCNERHKLVKILNDGRQIPIKSLKKTTFSIISSVFVIIGAGLLLLRLIYQ